ncbi:MAG: hypothetical protein FWE03_07255 [Firmicutes bacterium]|nr:hypothetical protein [Bacillota bacterium]
MKKKLFCIICVLFMITLPFLAASDCDNNPDTFTVQFIVNEEDVTAPDDMTVEVGDSFILPTITRNNYRLYWRIYGATAGSPRAAGGQMPYTAHNTIAGGTLRLQASFEEIPLNEQELMQAFVVEINGLIAGLNAMAETELIAGIITINGRISSWNGITPVGLNTDQIANQTNRARDLFVARINGLITTLTNNASLTYQQVGISIGAIDAYVNAWPFAGVALTGLNTDGLATQRTRHMNLFVEDINALIDELEDITDHLDDLIEAITTIQTRISGWSGVTLANVNNAELSTQIQRRNDWIELRDMQNFVIEINQLILELDDMNVLFNLRRAINNIEGMIEDWDGLTPVGINFNGLTAAEQKVEGLEAEQGDMVERANEIIEQIRGFNIVLPDMQIIADHRIVTISVAVLAVPQIRVWGNLIHRTDIVVHASLLEAQALAATQANTYRYLYTTIHSAGATGAAFSRWFFAALVEHGAPGSILNEQGAIDQQFLAQRVRIIAEINNHLDRDRTGHPEFIYSQGGAIIFDSHAEPHRLILQIGST